MRLLPATLVSSKSLTISTCPLWADMRSAVPLFWLQYIENIDWLQICKWWEGRTLQNFVFTIDCTVSDQIQNKCLLAVHSALDRTLYIGLIKCIPCWRDGCWPHCQVVLGRRLCDHCRQRTWSMMSQPIILWSNWKYLFHHHYDHHRHHQIKSAKRCYSNVFTSASMNFQNKQKSCR